MKNFLKTQSSKSPSIFSEYLNSINSDVSVTDFQSKIYDIMSNSEAPEINLNFKKDKEQKNF